MAAHRDKVIITCAVTGAIHTPTMTPYLPITPEAIAEGAIGAWKAGAAIIPLHARAPQGGGRPRSQGVLQFLPLDQGRDRCGDQHHDWRRSQHDQQRLAWPLGVARDVPPTWVR
jgi:uncharacterized protein (DUF849 family)